MSFCGKNYLLSTHENRIRIAPQTIRVCGGQDWSKAAGQSQKRLELEEAPQHPDGGLPKNEAEDAATDTEATFLKLMANRSCAAHLYGDIGFGRK